MSSNGERPEVDGDPQLAKLSGPQRLESHILGRMLSGLLVLIPLLITIWILYFVLSHIDDFVRAFLSNDPLDVLDRPGVGVVIALAFLYIVGALVASRLGRRAFDWPNAILSRIPVVRGIFGVAKQATDALTSTTGHQFSRVVFVEWPRRGTMAMGFVTGHCHSPLDDRSLIAIYIPTVPNPTSGNLTFVTEDEVVETDISVEDAMKVVFSGGIVLPKAMEIRSRLSLLEPPDGS